MEDYDEEWFKICIEHTINVEYGWNVEQSYTTDSNSIYYYSLRVKPYIKGEINIHPYFQLDELFKTDLTLDMAEFSAYVFGEVLIFENGYLCFNLGRGIEDILVTVDATMMFMDCYKTLLDTLDYEEILLELEEFFETGMLLDTCDYSNDEDIAIY